MDNSEDESMEQDEKDNDDTSKVKGQDATSRQNEKLYSVEGILNTKMRKAEKKRRKKANNSISSVSTDAMEDDDYDFKVDFKKK